jgi:hypothetical protein
VLVALLLISGSQFTLFAMWFDMDSSRELGGRGRRHRQLARVSQSRTVGGADLLEGPATPRGRPVIVRDGAAEDGNTCDEVLGLDGRK